MREGCGRWEVRRGKEACRGERREVREFVAASVELAYYVEPLHGDATSAAALHAYAEPEAAPTHRR